GQGRGGGSVRHGKLKVTRVSDLQRENANAKHTAVISEANSREATLQYHGGMLPNATMKRHRRGRAAGAVAVEASGAGDLLTVPPSPKSCSVKSSHTAPQRWPSSSNGPLPREEEAALAGWSLFGSASGTAMRSQEHKVQLSSLPPAVDCKNSSQSVEASNGSSPAGQGVLQPICEGLAARGPGGVTDREYNPTGGMDTGTAPVVQPLGFLDSRGGNEPDVVGLGKGAGAETTIVMAPEKSEPEAVVEKGRRMGAGVGNGDVEAAGVSDLHKLLQARDRQDKGKRDMRIQQQMHFARLHR
ncbi:unnamed protein product, partial [Choristocarpus tenellus]